MKKSTYLLPPLISLMAVQAQPAAAQDGQFLLEELVVTATRRDEKLQDVPVSITAFNSETLENARLATIEDIAQLTPGLLGSNFSEANPIFAVRGATNTFSSAGTSKPVGVFIDDVYISRNSASDFDLFDLEQVAVFRGPQGTLFGRNVTAGAIQITTAKPSLEETSAKLKAEIGNLGSHQFAGLVNGPLGDTVAAKLSISKKKRDGYLVDRFNGLDYNNIDSFSARGQVLFQPSAELEIIGSLDFSNDDTNSRGYTFVSNSNGSNTTGNDGDIRTGEINIPQLFDRDIFGASVTANWDLSAGEFTSITAYRKADVRELSSLSPGAAGLTAIFAQTVQDDIDKPSTFSQEFRFVSEASETFDYVLGAYIYLNETERTRSEVRTGGLSRDHFHNTTADNDSYAIYGDATYHLLDGVLDFSLGGRYTTEDVSIDIGFSDLANSANDFTASDNDSFNEFTTRAVLTWHATDNLNIFASRTEGFTAGGFNSEVNNQAVIQFAFDPETITAYELGMKASWMDGHLTTNLTLFDQSYENKQEGFFNLQEFIFSVFNAADATMQGAEFEASFIPSETVSLNLSYAYLDTEYDSFQIPGGADFSGNELSNAPQNTFSASLDVRQPLENAGFLILNASYSDVGEYFTGASNVDNFRVGDYSLINASIGYETTDGNWSVRLWGSNLADEEYVLIRGVQFGIGEHFGAPRTYGATLTYQLN